MMLTGVYSACGLSIITNGRNLGSSGMICDSKRWLVGFFRPYYVRPLIFVFSGLLLASVSHHYTESARWVLECMYVEVLSGTCFKWPPEIVRTSRVIMAMASMIMIAFFTIFVWPRLSRLAIVACLIFFGLIEMAETVALRLEFGVESIHMDDIGGLLLLIFAGVMWFVLPSLAPNARMVRSAKETKVLKNLL